MIYVKNIAKISQIADEILYLQKSRGDLKTLASQYISIVKTNYESIKFFPSVEAELKESLEKRNFNIANAKEKIDTLNGSLKKMDYIKLSVNGYDNISDSVVRKKADIENFKRQIASEIQNVKLRDIDKVYNQVVSKYNELNLQTSHVGDIRSKYSKLKQIFDANKGVLMLFPQVDKELTDYINLMGLDEAKADYYLNSSSDVFSRLSNVKIYINVISSLSKDELRAIDPKVINSLQGVQNTMSYNTVTQTAENARKNAEFITSTIKALKDLRSFLSQLQSKLNSNKGNIFPSDYAQLSKEISQVEPTLYTNLNPSFASSNALLTSLEGRINTCLQGFSVKNNESQQLFQKLEAYKTKYWLEDYNAIAAKIQSVKGNQGGVSFSSVNNEIDSKRQVKENQIAAFSRNNFYILNASDQLSVLNSRFTNSLVSSSEFQKFAASVQKNKALKAILYKIKDGAVAIGKFLTKPSTLKLGAILLAIGLGLVFVISYWKEILIVGGIIFLIFVFLNAKK